jgi:hypothetical protein
LIARIITSAIALFSVTAIARAEEGPASSDSNENAPASRDKKTQSEKEKAAARNERAVLREPSGYLHTMLGAAIGKGMRFNNPYRLSTQLGESAESVSLTAAYIDFSLGLALGDFDGLQHGGMVHFGTSLEGVSQTFVSASYVALYRGPSPFMFYGRVGPSVLITPDVNVGGEIAASATWLFTGALGLTSELVFDLYYGAATLDSTFSVLPVLSFQLGVLVDFEVLP